MKNASIFLFLGLICSFCLARTKETPMSYTEGSITSMSVLPPSGTFLLVRQKNVLCAIQFTGIWRGNDAESGSALHSGDETFRARYVWYLGERTSHSSIIHPTKASGEGDLSQGRLVGLGRLAFGTGKSRIQCGPIRLFWTAPANVYFSDGRPTLLQDQGNEIAVTKWTKFEQIDPNDPTLVWLRYDKNRAVSRIGVEAVQ